MDWMRVRGREREKERAREHLIVGISTRTNDFQRAWASVTLEMAQNRIHCSLLQDIGEQVHSMLLAITVGHFWLRWLILSGANLNLRLKRFLFGQLIHKRTHMIDDKNHLSTCTALFMCWGHRVLQFFYLHSVKPHNRAGSLSLMSLMLMSIYLTQRPNPCK